MSYIGLSTLGLVLTVFAALLALMAAAGWAAASRRSIEREPKLLDELGNAERALAQAHALDKGWDRVLLDSAVRAAVAQTFGSVDVRALQLVQVIDRPGTDADQAVFRIQTATGDEHTITLGRSGGVWGPA